MDAEDREVVVALPGGVVLMQQVVEDAESVDPGTDFGSQRLVVACRGRLADFANREPQGGCGPAGGGVDVSALHCLDDEQPEVAGEDLAAGVRIGDEPERGGQVVEGCCDYLAQGIGVLRLCPDDLFARAHDVLPSACTAAAVPAAAAKAVVRASTALLPRPIAA